MDPSIPSGLVMMMMMMMEVVVVGVAAACRRGCPLHEVWPSLAGAGCIAAAWRSVRGGVEGIGRGLEWVFLAA